MKLIPRPRAIYYWNGKRTTCNKYHKAIQAHLEWCARPYPNGPRLIPRDVYEALVARGATND